MVKCYKKCLQSMLQASFSIVDQIMIGQLGETNISAVGLCSNFSLIFSVGNSRCIHITYCRRNIQAGCSSYYF